MKPVIFSIFARRNFEAGVWTGESQEVPVAADAPSLGELLRKAAAQTLDLLPDNHPDVDPDSVHLQFIVLREANAIPTAV